VSRISSLSYEKSLSKGNVIISNANNSEALIRFKDDNIISFSINSAKQLRKLLEATKEGLALLVNNEAVYGIGQLDDSEGNYKFVITDQMEWHVLIYQREPSGIKATQALFYNCGRYNLPIAAEINDKYIDNMVKNKDIRITVKYLLGMKYMNAFNHGAIIIITDKAEFEVSRLCKLDKGIRIDKRSVFTNSDILSALCAIDGAIFLDNGGNCHGFGIILDGLATTIGTPARGSRFNSTKSYIARCIKKDINACALVISADGDHDIITSDDEDITLKKRKMSSKEI
jgi:hypothetical protein